MQNQISSGDAEKSSNILTPRRKSQIHFNGQFVGIYETLRRADLKTTPHRSENVKGKKALSECRGGGEDVTPYEKYAMTRENTTLGELGGHRIRTK